MMMPFIGVGLWGMQSTVWYTRDQAALYREMIEEIVCAEEQGFDFALFTEHHFAADGSCPSILLTSAAAAQATSKIGIGTGLLLLPLHNERKVTEQVGTLHALLGQRLILGVGLGYRQIEFIGHSQDRARRVELLKERVALLREQVGDRATSPLNIWIGGHVEATARRAGALGSGLMLSSTIDLTELSRLFKIHAAHLAHASTGSHTSHRGHLRGTLRSVWVAKTDEEAREYAIPRLRYLWEQQYGGWGMFTDIARNAGAARRNDGSEQATQALDYAIVGSPSTVVEGLKKVFEAGAQYVVCRVQTGTQSHEAVMNCLQLLGAEVLPQLKEQLQ